MIILRLLCQIARHFSTTLSHQSTDNRKTTGKTAANIGRASKLKEEPDSREERQIRRFDGIIAMSRNWEMEWIDSHLRI